jgi:hypothetical protein
MPAFFRSRNTGGYIGAHHEDDALLHLSSNELSGDHIEVKEAPMIGHHEEALLAVERTDALKTVHPPEVLRAVMNPGLPHSALKKPQHSIEPTRLEGGAHDP